MKVSPIKNGPYVMWAGIFIMMFAIPAAALNAENFAHAVLVAGGAVMMIGFVISQ